MTPASALFGSQRSHSLGKALRMLGLNVARVWGRLLMVDGVTSRHNIDAHIGAKPAWCVVVYSAWH